ncbi:ATP-binding mismatch repair protein [Cyanidiococcus yangmingshanensis]|uniref:ATP-binding mismatch repair protein n=1 Tax=Cyanidiococcus yangmingshanensis TaxID=2690220 RepID=A0A7J7IP16_9RHOD|nr:ATP-binding mismatch repair protein [Cyanidiococcus yangmingshanensis]
MIQALPPDVVRHLASAPVITGVASAVKELVENALDSRATRISIFFGGYGLELIEVSDDGDGISRQNLEVVARPHTTSKLRHLTDLRRVQSYGFRGEALAALALVGRLQVVSRPRETGSISVQHTAFRANYEAGKRTGDLEPEARTYGTTVRVLGLFESIPVRRREAESQKKRELQRAVHMLQTYALAAPTVRFYASWTAKGRGSATLCLATQGSCTLRECIGLLYGTEQLAGLTSIDLSVKWPTALVPDAAQNSIRLNGYFSCCHSGTGRSSADRQVLLLQRSRPVQWPRMRRMLDAEFRRLTNSRQHPVFVLSIELPPEGFDINTSPDKSEVLIHDDIAVVAAVREALLTHWAMTTSASTTVSVVQLDGATSTEPGIGVYGNRRAAVVASRLHQDSTLVNCEDTDAATLAIEGDTVCDQYEDTSRTGRNRNEPRDRIAIAGERSAAHVYGMGMRAGPVPSQEKFHDSERPVGTLATSCMTMSRDKNVTSLPCRMRIESSPMIERSGTNNESFPMPSSGTPDRAVETADSELTAFVACPATERRLELQMTVDVLQTTLLKSSSSNTMLRIEKRPSTQTLLQSAHIGERLQLAHILEGQEQNTNEDQQLAPTRDADRELEQRFHKDWFRDMEIIGQFNRGFLLARHESDLFIIDQHAADEKFIYEQLARSLRARKQHLLQAIAVPASASEELVLWEHRTQLEALGFELEFRWHEQPTQRVWMRSVPTVYQNLLDATDLLEIAHQAPFTGQDDELLRASQIKLLLATRACRRAVMIGTPLDRPHMQSIVAHLAELEQPWNCPHGRPTMRHLLQLSDLYRTDEFA